MIISKFDKKRNSSYRESGGKNEPKRPFKDFIKENSIKVLGEK